jgi:subtilisin family serine protease
MLSDIEVVEFGAAGPALIRPGQLLTDGAALPAVEPWAQAVAEVAGLYKVHLTPGVDPCELATTLREQGHLAAPNHVLAGQPLFFGGPASRPFPADPVEAAPGRDDACAVTIGLLDTGIAAHPWWADRPWFKEQARGAAETADADGDGRLDAQAGHGTFIAGLLLRRAPGVRLHVQRILDSRGIGDEAGLVNALARLRERPPQVLNLSLGGHSFDDRPSPLLARAIAALPGTVTVAAAGNTASARPFWPAALPDVIGVGSLDTTESARSAFSAHGPWVNACARGEWLVSSFLDVEGFAGFASWSGTSFATALVAGAIANAIAEGEAGTPREAADRVLDPARHRQIRDLGVVVPASR